MITEFLLFLENLLNQLVTLLFTDENSTVSLIKLIIDGSSRRGIEGKRLSSSCLVFYLLIEQPRNSSSLNVWDFVFPMLSKWRWSSGCNVLLDLNIHCCLHLILKIVSMISKNPKVNYLEIDQHKIIHIPSRGRINTNSRLLDSSTVPVFGQSKAIQSYLSLIVLLESIFRNCTYCWTTQCQNWASEINYNSPNLQNWCGLRIFLQMKNKKATLLIVQILSNS